MRDYSSYTSEDFLLDEQFIHWYYTGKGDYYQDIADLYPERLPYLKEAMDMLVRVKWIKPTLPVSEINDACQELINIIIKQETENNKTHIRKVLVRVAAVAAVFVLFFSPMAVQKLYEKKETGLESWISQLTHVNDSLFIKGKTCLFVDNHLEEVFTDQPNLNYYQENQPQRNGLNKLIVSYGKRAQLTLSDGSKIWANAGTVLLYPSQFEDDFREIYVNGEVYVDVASNPEHPFIIKTREMEVRVIGTSFNVSAYQDEAEKSVVLVTGKVQVATPDGHRVNMLPNERYTQSVKGYQVDEVNAMDYGSWKDGQLIFSKTDMAVILRKLSRHYNVKISYGDLSGISCSGKLNLDDHIDAVLQIVAETAPIRIIKLKEQYVIQVKTDSLWENTQKIE